MNHRLRTGVVLGVLVVFVVGTVWASNMGFLINCTLLAATPGLSWSGVNTLNLPYQQASAPDSAALKTEIGASAVSVARYLEASNTLETFTGNKGSPPPFPINPGECYFVKMAATTDYVIEGAHLPGMALALDKAGPGNLSGTNFISLPYHSCARDAKQLMDDIGFSSVAFVSRYLRATDTLHSYSGIKGSAPNFSLSPCECYFVKMRTSVSYVPSHY